jgi:hypothetical protein
MRMRVRVGHKETQIMRALLPVLACVLLISSCGNSPMSTSSPTVTIGTPMDGSVVPIISPATTADIEVKFTVTNFTLEAPNGQPNVQGHGHGHLFLDAATNYAAAGISPLTAMGVPAGMHKLKVELHNNDHSLVDGVDPAVIMVNVQ